VVAREWHPLAGPTVITTTTIATTTTTIVSTTTAAAAHLAAQNAHDLAPRAGTHREVGEGPGRGVAGLLLERRQRPPVRPVAEPQLRGAQKGSVDHRHFQGCRLNDHREATRTQGDFRWVRRPHASSRRWERCPNNRSAMGGGSLLTFSNQSCVGFKQPYSVYYSLCATFL